VPGPGVERLVTEAVEQGVDGGEAVGDAELALEERADLGPAEGAGSVLGEGARAHPKAESIEFRLGQSAGSPPAGAVGQAVEAPEIVTGDPLLDGPPAGAECRGDLGRGPSGEGEDDGAEPEEAVLGGFLIGKDLKSFEAEVVGDMHDGISGVLARHFPMHASKAQGRANIF